MAAFASYQNGYLGYIVILGTSVKGIYYVVVDTDNGRILSRENITRRTTKETQFRYGYEYQWINVFALIYKGLLT